MGDKAPPPQQNKPPAQQQQQQQQQQQAPKAGPSGRDGDRKKPNFTCIELVDLALASPEVGAVNFNILRMLLRDIVEKTGIDKSSVKINDLEAHQVENYKNYAEGAAVASPMPGILRIGQQGPAQGQQQQSQRSQQQRQGGPPQQQGQRQQGEQGQSPGQSQGQGQSGPQGQQGQQQGPRSGGPSTPRTPRPPPQQQQQQQGGVALPDEVYDKIEKLEQQLEALYQLPANNEILQKAGESGHAVNDMWQIIQLNNRIAAAEAAIQKMASLIEDLAKNMGRVKSEAKTLKRETDDLNSKTSDIELTGTDLSDKCAQFTEQLNTLGKELNDVKTAWKQDRDNLEKMLGVDLGKIPTSMKPKKVSPRSDKADKEKRGDTPTSAQFERGTQTFVHKGDERAKPKPKKAKEEYIPPEEIAKMTAEDILNNITPEELKQITPAIYKEFSTEQKKALNDIRKRAKEMKPASPTAAAVTSTTESRADLSPREIKEMDVDQVKSIPQNVLDSMTDEQREAVNQILSKSSSDSLASIHKEINEIKKAWVQDREKLEKVLGINLGKTPSAMKPKPTSSSRRAEPTSSRSEREAQAGGDKRAKSKPKKAPEEYITPDEMMKMTPEEILEKITSEELKQITTAKYKEFSNEQKKALTEVRKRAKQHQTQTEAPKKPAAAAAVAAPAPTIGVSTMTPEELAKLSPEAIGKMNPKEAAEIPQTVLEQMSQEQRQMVQKALNRGSDDKLAALQEELYEMKRVWLQDRENLEKLLGVDLGQSPSLMKIKAGVAQATQATEVSPRSEGTYDSDLYETKTDKGRSSRVSGASRVTRPSKVKPKQDYISPEDILQMTPEDILQNVTAEELDLITPEMYEEFTPEQKQAVEKIKRSRLSQSQPQKGPYIDAQSIVNMSPEEIEDLPVETIERLHPDDASRLPSAVLDLMSEDQRETVRKVIARGRKRTPSGGEGRDREGDLISTRSERETQTIERKEGSRAPKKQKKPQEEHLSPEEISKMTPYDIMHHAPADDLKHQFPAVYKEFKKGDERDSTDDIGIDEETQALFPAEHGKHPKHSPYAQMKSLMLLDLEKIREEIRTKGMGTFDEQDIIERLGAVWEALKILKHNEEALAIKIARQDAVIRKIPQKAVEKLQKVPDENLEALISGNFGKGTSFIEDRKTKEVKDVHDFPKALQSTWRGGGGGGVAEREDIQTLFNNLANVISECADQKDRLDEMADVTKALETGMVTKQMLVDALTEKADKGMLNTKVSFDEFGNTIDELHTQLHNLMVEGYQRNENWKKVTADLADELAEKIDKTELAPIRAFFKSHLKSLEEKVKNLSRLIEEPDPAGTRKKLLKDYNCLSCDRMVNISGVTNGPKLPTIGPILAGHPTASKRALDIQRMRCFNHFEPAKKNLNALERQGKMNMKINKNKPPTTPDKPNDKDVIPAVNRYTGGSHTEITNADLVASQRKSMRRSDPPLTVQSNTGVSARPSAGNMEGEVSASPSAT